MVDELTQCSRVTLGWNTPSKVLKTGGLRWSHELSADARRRAGSDELFPDVKPIGSIGDIAARVCLSDDELE